MSSTRPGASRWAHLRVPMAVVTIWAGTAMLSGPAVSDGDSKPAGRWIEGEGSAFRLSRSGGKHRLMHPDGQPFVPLGVNHIGAVARDKAFFASRYKGSWSEFREHLDQQFDRWSMNCVGYGAPEALHRQFPYFATITLARIEKHRSHPDPASRNGYLFPDPFDPEWAVEIGRRIREMCERHRANRLLIGYLWTDTPTWDVIKTRGLRGTDWVSQIRRQPGTQPVVVATPSS